MNDPKTLARLADKLTDLDFAILAVLPVEGARMGHHTYAKHVITVVEELGGVTSAQVQGRMRSLKYLELTTTAVVQPVSRGVGWQVTPLGQQVLHTRRQQPNATIHTLPWVKEINNGVR